MEPIKTLMQRGLAAGANDEWYDDEWCVDVVKRYVDVPNHSVSDEELLHEFLAHAYIEWRMDFLQYMPDFFKPDYDFWAKVYDQLPEQTQSEGFYFHLISEYAYSDYGQPDDIRWYESMAEECDVDYNDQETIFELFKTAYLDSSSDGYKHQLVRHTKAWLDTVGLSITEFYEEEDLEQMEVSFGEDECEFIKQVYNYNWRIDFYRANGINIIGDEDDVDKEADDEYVEADEDEDVEAIRARLLALDEIRQVRSKLPLELNQATTLSDVCLYEDTVSFELVTNGNFISIDNIKNNVDVYKEGSISEIVANMNDLCSTFHAAGLGVGIQYRDRDTAQTVEINITNDELAHALQNPNDEQQQLESQIRSLKATCPRDLGGGFVFNDCALDGEYVTRTIMVDEAEVGLNDLAAHTEPLRKALSNIVLDEANFSFIALVFKTGKGLRDNYLGKDTGQVVTVELSPGEIKEIITREAKNENARYWKKRLLRGCVSWAVLIALIVALVKFIKFLAS